MPVVSKEDWDFKVNQTYYSVMIWLRSFWTGEEGQDLIEYTLLMAFVTLASAALFLGAGGSVAGIWTTSNSQLAAANSGS